jgi:hypothetical protein
MEFSTQLESLQQTLSRDILAYIKEALQDSSSTERIKDISRPVLRFELFVEEADELGNNARRNCDNTVPSIRRPLVSVSHNTLH